MASIPRSEFVEGGISDTAVERIDADNGGGMVVHNDVDEQQSSMVWKAAFVGATTPDEVNLVLKNVRDAELRYSDAVSLNPSDDATPLVIRMPLVRPSRSTKTGLPELSKQLVPVVKNPITPVLHGIVAPSKPETEAIEALVGPLMMTKPNLVIMAVQGQDGVLHAAFFLETDKKEPNAYTYGFARLKNGVVDDSAVVLVCGKHSPSRHMDTFASDDVTKKFINVDFGNEKCTADVKSLAAWFVVSVNARIEDRYGLTMPNEAASKLTTFMSKRVDMFKLWGMRVPLCSRWHKSALERLENVGKEVVPKPRRARKPKEVKPARTMTAPAPAPMRGRKKRDRTNADEDVDVRTHSDADDDADIAEDDEAEAEEVDNDDDEDVDDDNVDEEEDVRPSKSKRRRPANAADDFFADLNECGTVFDPVKSGQVKSGRLYSPGQLKDVLRDAQCMFLMAMNTGQKVSIVLGDVNTKKTTKTMVFDNKRKPSASASSSGRKRS